MRFSPSFLEKLRDKIKLSSIISKRVSLKKHGKDFFGLCPFHNEKTPSFSVNDDKRFYYCFGCGAHGSIIDFVQKTQGLSFPETVKQLAQTHGIDLPKDSEQEDLLYKSKLKIFEINLKALDWFRKNLHSNSAAQALDYLHKRSITDALIKKFALGFAPVSKNSLLEHLKLSGYSAQEIKDAGLAKELSDGILVDTFRNRIIFPILNSASKVIAFGGRAMFDGQPKYLNSPETEVFQKRQTLYCENFALNSAQNLKDLYIVEGYTDVIALHKAGIENVVATLGTSISAEHIKKLWNTVSEPTFCMDGDAAGVKAMARAADIVLPLLSSGFSINFVKLPKGRDPDDIVKNSGAKFMQELLAIKISLCDALWSIALSTNDVSTPEKQAQLRAGLIDKTTKIPDYNVRNFYNKYFNNKISSLLYKANNSYRTPSAKVKLENNVIQVQTMPVLQRYELNIVAIIMEMPSLLIDNAIFEKLISIEIRDSKVKTLYTLVLELFTELGRYDNHEEFNTKFKINLADKLDSSTLKYLCGVDTYFLDKASIKDPKHAENLWNKTFDCYSLELLKQEYKAVLDKAHESKSLDIAKQLRQEIISKGQLIREIYD